MSLLNIYEYIERYIVTQLINRSETEDHNRLSENTLFLIEEDMETKK